MQILADYHVHSHHSGDSDAPMNEVVESAISKGLKFLCFTEHMDIDYPEYPQDNITKNTFLLDAKTYKNEFLKIKDKYKDQIELHYGVELGLQPHVLEENKAFLSENDFEFVIGSNHICNRKDPYYPEFFMDRSEQDAMNEFFESTLENIRLFNNYDVLGHLDYAIRYAPTKGADYSYDQHRDIIDEILKQLISDGKGLDVNTKALYSGMPQPNPDINMLKRFRELGGEIITFGSDAHKAADISNKFDTAADIVRAAGFTSYCIFKNRKPVFYNL